jgi:uncharacterized membrane protein
MARMVPRALPRIAIGAVVGFGTGALLSLRYSFPIALLGGWNAGGLTLLALAWLVIASADPETTGHRAAAEDPGRTAATVVVLLGSLAALVAVTVLVRRPGATAPREQLELVGLCLSTAMVSWTLTHTVFALRYAHLYYRRDLGAAGGVEFPGGGRPRYLDFAYLAFTVGMTFQVSDTAVARPHIRHTVLLHAVLSFLYTSAILAFIINLVAGMAGAQS